jgi:hypothetical protein
VTRPGGLVAAYVWDDAGRMELMRRFWDAAAAVDPAGAVRELSHREHEGGDDDTGQGRDDGDADEDDSEGAVAVAPHREDGADGPGDGGPGSRDETPASSVPIHAPFTSS